MAIKVFADNLRDLLLAAPAGPQAVMGLDPGIRTGVKVAVVSTPAKCWTPPPSIRMSRGATGTGALHTLAGWCAAHGVNLIAIGNGTASRETDELAAELIKRVAEGSARCRAAEGGGQREPVRRSTRPANSPARNCPNSTSACAARSASRAACRTRWPNWSRSIRRASAWASTSTTSTSGDGAARWMPWSRTASMRVGVDLNTASAPLAVARIGAVAGGGRRHRALARCTRRLPQPQATARRGGAGAEDLRAGCRVPAHPRRRQPARCQRRAPRDLRAGAASGRRGGPAGRAADGRADVLRTLKPEAFADERFGAITVKDILAELEKPGRDPRPISRRRASTRASTTSRTCSRA